MNEWQSLQNAVEAQPVPHKATKGQLKSYETGKGVKRTAAARRDEAQQGLPGHRKEESPADPQRTRHGQESFFFAGGCLG